MAGSIEYQVRPVTRYVITRYEASNDGCGCAGVGEFASEHQAIRVAHDLGFADQARHARDWDVTYPAFRDVASISDPLPKGLEQ